MMTITCRFLGVLAVIISLTACAHFDNARQNRYTHLKPANLDVAANNWFTVLSQTRSGGLSDKEQGREYGPEVDWTDKNIEQWSEAAAIRGIRNGLPKSRNYDYLNETTKRLGSLFEGSAYIQDYIERTEWPVIARTKIRPDNDSIFDLEILHRFTSFSVPETISISNAAQGHYGNDTDAQSHKVTDGQVCLFYLSPTYTRYRNAFAADGLVSQDPNVVLEAFPRYCEQKSGRYTYTQSGQGEPLLFRADILQLYPPIVKNTQRPTHLAKTNNIEMRGEWDIVQIDDDRLGVPIGSLSINSHSTDLKLKCIPSLYGTKRVVAGKLISDYAFRYIDDQVEQATQYCANSPGAKIAKSLKNGIFYGDRQTIWFEGEHMSFIAKRSDRPPSTYGWNNWYKYLAVEACLLDHPNIGADKYAGFGRVQGAINVKFSLTGDAAAYWNDCKPDYELDFIVVEHSLPFLEARAEKLKLDLRQYGNQFITGGWVNQQNNSIAVSMDPKWALDNQDVVNQLKAEHPYIE